MTGTKQRLYLSRDQFMVRSNLVEILKKRDMSQIELSEQTGISRGSLSRMRYSAQLRLDFIARLMEVLECDFYELFEVIDVKQGRRVTGPRKRGAKVKITPPQQEKASVKVKTEKVEG